jgi:hypothetical protein
MSHSRVARTPPPLGRTACADAVYSSVGASQTRRGPGGVCGVRVTWCGGPGRRAGGGGGLCEKRAAGAWRGRSCMSQMVCVVKSVLADPNSHKQARKIGDLAIRAGARLGAIAVPMYAGSCRQRSRPTWSRGPFCGGRSSASQRVRPGQGIWRQGVRTGLPYTLSVGGTLPGASADPDVGVASR